MRNYARDEDSSLIVLIVCSCWLCAFGVLALYRTLRVVRAGPLSPSWWSCKACERGACWLFGDRDPLAKQVARELQHMRVIRANRLLPWGQAAATVYVISSTWRCFSVIRGTADSRFNSPVQDVAAVTIAAAVGMMWTIPRTVSARTLNIWFSLIMSCITAYMSPFAIQGRYVMTWAVAAYSCTFLACLFNLNLYLNALWLVLLCVSCCTSLFLDAEIRGDDDFQHSITQLVNSTLLLIIALCGVNALLQQVARSQLEASMSRNELAAASSVLRSVCDVVLELDGAFKLQAESPELADMLLLNPQRSLRGECLCSFLATPEDSSKFCEQMRTSRRPSSQHGDFSTAFNVCMKDGSGIILTIEVFSVSIEYREEQAVYFVGIRENADSSSAPQELSSGHSSGPPQRGSKAARRLRSRRRAKGSHGGDGGGQPGQTSEGAAAQSAPEKSVAEDNASDTDSERMSMVEADSAVWIDTYTSDWDVKHSTAGLRLSLGEIVKGNSFVNWLRKSQREPFIAWMQETVFHFEDGKAGPVRYSEPLRFPTDVQGKQKMELRAAAEVDMVPLPGAQEVEKGTVRVALRDPRWTQAVKGKRSDGNVARRRSGTPAAITSTLLGKSTASEPQGEPRIFESL